MANRRTHTALFILLTLVPFTATAQQPPKTPGPLARVGLEVMAGRTEDARKQILAVLETARKQNDVAQQAMCHLMLGMTEGTAGNTAAALTSLDEGARLFSTAGDHFGAFLTLWALGEMQSREAQFDESVATFERALAVLEKAAQPGESFSIERLQSIGGLFGAQMPEFGGGSFAAAPELFKPILLLFADATVRDGYGSALLEAGDLEKAERELGRARQSALLFGGIFDASLASHFGDLRRRQWRFEEAREEYAKALRGTGLLPVFSGQDDRVRIAVLNSLADIEILTGRTDEALAWNDQAIALVRASNSPSREARIMAQRANLLSRASRLDEAQSTFEEALKLAEKAGDLHRRGLILSDLALLDSTRGRFGTSVAHFEQAIKLLHEAHKPIDEAQAWTLVSNIYLGMGLSENARMALENAEKVAKESGFRASNTAVAVTAVMHRYMKREATAAEVNSAFERAAANPEWSSVFPRDMAKHLTNFLNAYGPDKGLALSGTAPGDPLPMFESMTAMLEARALLTQRKPQAARAALERALNTNVSRDARTAILGTIGITWAMEGDIEKASEALIASAKEMDLSLEDMRVEEMLASYVGDRHLFLDLLVEVLLRQGRTAEAFDFSERARARAFLQLIGNTRLAPGHGADVQLVRETEALRTQISEWETRPGYATAVSERRVVADLRQARERYAALVTRMKVSSSEYASLTTVQPLTVAQVRGELPDGTTLISFFATPWGVHAWLLDRSSFEHIVLPDSNAVTRAGCWAQQFGSAGRGVQPVPTDTCPGSITAEEVYGMLFAPLREKVFNRRLLIVPHGALHYVPFAALRDPETGRYLIEDFTLTYAPSASALRFLRAKETPVNGSAMVFGDPATFGNVDLPNALWEAVGVANALGTTPLLGTDAMESRMYELAGNVDLVHIAAHGSYDSASPLFSRIALAKGDGHDGNLEVNDILRDVDLTGVNLVVLAACESGLGKRSGGDDVVGLTRAFLYAGAPGVISTLWRISDEGTAMLMADFYCALTKGEPPADALRTAQLAMLHGGEPEPARWAAFSLYGNPRGRWSARSPHDGQ